MENKEAYTPEEIAGIMERCMYLRECLDSVSRVFIHDKTRDLKKDGELVIKNLETYYARYKEEVPENVREVIEAGCEPGFRSVERTLEGISSLLQKKLKQ